MALPSRRGVRRGATGDRESRAKGQGDLSAGQRLLRDMTMTLVKSREVLVFKNAILVIKFFEIFFVFVRRIVRLAIFV
jgi:hypothetical protein